MCVRKSEGEEVKVTKTRKKSILPHTNTMKNQETMSSLPSIGLDLGVPEKLMWSFLVLWYFQQKNQLTHLSTYLY